MKKLKIFLILLVLGVLGGDIFLYYKSNGLKENNVKIENSIEEYEEIVEKIHYYESWLNDSDHTLEFHKELEEKKCFVRAKEEFRE